MRSYLKKLNWSGFFFMLIICAIGLTSNKNVTTAGQWFLLFLLFGVPISSFFLFAGKDD